MENSCSFVDKPSWYSIKEFNEYAAKEYLPKKEFEKYFIFISSLKYKECLRFLSLNKDCIIRFHEIFGKYDFLAKAYQKNEDEKKIDKLNKQLISKRIIRPHNSVVYKKVCQQFKYKNDTFINEELIQKNCFELDADRLHFINAFITLKKKEKSNIEPDQLLTLISNIPDKKLATELIYKVYLLESDILIFHLNIDCRNIRRLNQFTIVIDQVADDNKYQKTTYISTNDHVNHKAIDTLFPSEEIITLK